MFFSAILRPAIAQTGVSVPPRAGECVDEDKATINRLLVSRPPPASSSTSRVPPIFQPGKTYAHAQVYKAYVTVLELTNTHHDVQLFRTIFATVDLYYPTRPFDAIFV